MNGFLKRRRWLLVFLLFSGVVGPLYADPILAESKHADSLAVDLSESRDHAGAAVEFRRRALALPTGSESGAYYWCSAYEYFSAGQAGIAEKMLMRAEESNTTLDEPVRLLRGETALLDHRLPEAAFEYEGLLESATTNRNARLFATKRLAVTHLRRGDPAKAKDVLMKSSEPVPGDITAVEHYAETPPKRPLVGGLLGMIPGLGYAYSKEYANGLRSFLLNGLFIFGMVETAQDDEWGAFAAISFFELTWYSGSIYGGIDAAHRYNLEQRETCEKNIMGNAGFAPDYTRLPLVSLRFTF